MTRFAPGSACGGSLHAGQRLAKPGLPGFSSNSSEQTAQTLMGYAMRSNSDFTISVGVLYKMTLPHNFASNQSASARGAGTAARSLLAAPKKGGVCSF